MKRSLLYSKLLFLFYVDVEFRNGSIELQEKAVSASENKIMFHTGNHIKGISPVKELYYIGLPWQSQRSSALICGVGKDAAYVLSEIKKIDQ